MAYHSTRMNQVTFTDSEEQLLSAALGKSSNFDTHRLYTRADNGQLNEFMQLLGTLGNDFALTRAVVRAGEQNGHTVTDIISDGELIHLYTLDAFEVCRYEYGSVQNEYKGACSVAEVIAAHEDSTVMVTESWGFDFERDIGHKLHDNRRYVVIGVSPGDARHYNLTNVSQISIDDMPAARAAVNSSSDDGTENSDGEREVVEVVTTALILLMGGSIWASIGLAAIGMLTIALALLAVPVACIALLITNVVMFK